VDLVELAAGKLEFLEDEVVETEAAKPEPA